MMLWDTKDLTNLKTETIDSSSGVIMPFYAEGNDVLILAGKGDGNIRYYEYADDELHYLSEFKSSDPQRGFTLAPRHSLEVSQHEIARGFKLTTGMVEPLAFVVPRKAEGFQADIFPPAPSLEAALTADEWVSGKTSPPKVIDLKTKAITSYDGPKTASPPAASTPPAPKEEPKPAPVKQSSITEKTGKLPDLRDLEIKQDDPDSDEEITEAKKRAPSTGGFDDEEEVAEAKPAEKAVEVSSPAAEPESVKAEESVKTEPKQEAPPVTKLEPPKDEASTPAVQDNQSSAKEVRFPLF
jgi:coronin-1B/1C/6